MRAGMAMTTIQAPSTNLAWITSSVTIPVAVAPSAVHDGALAPAGLFEPQPAAHHACLGEREGGEDADDVEVDEGDDVGVEDPDQDGGQAGEHDDPVRVDEPVAEVHELAGEVAVAGEDGGQPREALVRRVGGEDEDPERDRLDERST